MCIYLCFLIFHLLNANLCGVILYISGRHFTKMSPRKTILVILHSRIWWIRKYFLSIFSQTRGKWQQIYKTPIFLLSFTDRYWTFWTSPIRLLLSNRPYRLFSFTQWPRFHIKLILACQEADKDYIPMFSWTNLFLAVLRLNNKVIFTDLPSLTI
jgi:hypothetical protein